MPAMDSQRMEKDEPLGRIRSNTGDAYALHELVPPDRWCVTRSNLDYLHKEVGKAVRFPNWNWLMQSFRFNFSHPFIIRSFKVKDALRRGEIQQDEREQFKSSNSIYGPSIYTVRSSKTKGVGVQWMADLISGCRKVGRLML